MDKYDVAIDWLVANADVKLEDGRDANQIELAWGRFTSHPAGCLFYFAKPHDASSAQHHGNCGCLTMIANPILNRVAWTTELTNAIKADKRIPISTCHFDYLRGDELRRVLEVFAFWQRRLDREIRGVIDVQPVEVAPPVVEPIQHANWCGTTTVSEYPIAVTTTEDVREEAFA